MPIMSFMFEVLYKSPASPSREATIREAISPFGGCLTCRGGPDQPGFGPICLTYEFTDRQVAEQAASSLRLRGEHVEGSVDYGD